MRLSFILNIQFAELHIDVDITNASH